MLSHIFVTPWTVACQALLSMGFPRQEYWNGLPFPSPGDHPDPEIKPPSPASPALAGGLFTIVSPGKPLIFLNPNLIFFLCGICYYQFHVLSLLNISISQCLVFLNISHQCMQYY